MTIILGAHCPKWGMLAADSLITGVAKDSSLVCLDTHTSKIRTSSDVQVAISIGGSAETFSPLDERIPLLSAIENCFSKLVETMTSRQVGEVLIQELQSSFLGFANAMQADGYATERLLEISFIYILSLAQGTVSASVVRLGSGEIFDPISTFWYHSPYIQPTIEDTYLNLQRDLTRHIVYTKQAYDVACRRDQVAVEEGRITTRTVGGHLEVVVVTPEKGVHVETASSASIRKNSEKRIRRQRRC